jgi:hypothetical protein
MKRTKLRKNFQIESVPMHLTEAVDVASFLGITLNALYLRLHFENFPTPTKLNGKLWFDMKEVIAHLQVKDSAWAYAWLVRDEIRTLIDTGVLSRSSVGNIINPQKPSVTGGAIYLRPLSYERAVILAKELTKSHKLHIPQDHNVQVAQERIKYIFEIWDTLVELQSANKINEEIIGKMVTKTKPPIAGRGIMRLGPSWRVAKILYLSLLSKNYL